MVFNIDLDKIGSFRNLKLTDSKDKNLIDIFGKEELTKLINQLNGKQVISIYSVPQFPVNYSNLEGLYFSRGILEKASELGIYGTFFQSDKICERLGQVYDIVSINKNDSKNSNLSSFIFNSSNGSRIIQDIVLANDAINAFKFIDAVRNQYYLRKVDSNPGIVFHQEDDHASLD